MIVMLSAERRLPPEVLAQPDWSGRDDLPAVVTALAPGGEPTHRTVRFRWLR